MVSMPDYYILDRKRLFVVVFLAAEAKALDGVDIILVDLLMLPAFIDVFMPLAPDPDPEAITGLSLACYCCMAVRLAAPADCCDYSTMIAEAATVPQFSF